jgi:hypothetical protein
MTNLEKKQLILDFINGPLQRYLTGDISFGKFKELINEQLGTDFIYSDLYPSYLFNASITYPDSVAAHKSDCPWHKDWHACSCGVF